ncbi:MAG: 2-C-methyl-D-erythritol 4-phosphate cytidylyltransferase [Firmicutes bacterium]|nr:2-C-methyl-D-erythritol 4-phosphate cytidylyltransferase [Bacillota bacterium]
MVRIMAVVPAAGQGGRMGTETRKQFLPLAGIPVLGHVLRVFEESPFIQGVVISAAPDELEYCREQVVLRLGFKKVSAVVPGGKERQDSVYNGLLALSSDTDIVVIHDGARPLLTAGDLAAVTEAVRIHGAATLAVPVKDTVKVAGESGFVYETLPRGRLWLTQTPQAFNYRLLLDAHHRAREAGRAGTDDAGLVETAGHPVKLVMGSYENIKITTPEDLVVAEAILESRRNNNK